MIDTVLNASLEIRSSIVSATVVIMLVFLPLLFLDGLEGRLLRPLATSYLIALFASLIVAVTVTPALCAILLPRGTSQTDSPVLRWLGRVYRPVLGACIRHPLRMLAAATLLVAAGAVSLFSVGRSFLPEFNEGSLTISMVLLPGTSLEASDSLASMAEQALLRDPAVRSVARRTGRAERDEHVLGVETSELEVALSDGDPRSKERIFADVRARLRVVPGAFFTLGQPLSHRIEHMVSGQRSELAIKIFGSDLSRIRGVAEEVRSAIAETEGLVDLGVEQVVDLPQIDVRIDAGRASQ